MPKTSENTTRARQLVAELIMEVEQAPGRADKIFTAEDCVQQAKRKEWDTLWSALMLPSMREVFDGDVIAERLDVLRMEIVNRVRADREREAAHSIPNSTSDSNVLVVQSSDGRPMLLFK